MGIGGETEGKDPQWSTHAAQLLCDQPLGINQALFGNNSRHLPYLFCWFHKSLPEA